MSSVEEFIYAVNPYTVYGFTILLTLLVILNRTPILTLPRSLVMVSWYSVVTLALSWLFFHIASLFNSQSQIVGLAVVARMLQFVPVYVCALIVLFMYPKKSLPP